MLEILERGWQWVVTKGINMRGERSNASISDCVAQKGERRLSKSTLRQIHQENVGFEDVQDSGEVRG